MQALVHWTIERIRVQWNCKIRGKVDNSKTIKPLAIELYEWRPFLKMQPYNDGWKSLSAIGLVFNSCMLLFSWMVLYKWLNWFIHMHSIWHWKCEILSNAHRQWRVKKWKSTGCRLQRYAAEKVAALTKINWAYTFFNFFFVSIPFIFFYYILYTYCISGEICKYERNITIYLWFGQMSFRINFNLIRVNFHLIWI